MISLRIESGASIPRRQPSSTCHILVNGINICSDIDCILPFKYNENQQQVKRMGCKVQVIIMILLAIGSALRIQHHEQSITSTPQQVLESVKDVYRRYLLPDDAEFESRLFLKLYPVSADHQDYSQSQFQQYLTSTGTIVTRVVRELARQLWLADALTYVKDSELTPNDLRKIIAEAVWLYVVDGYFSSADADHDGVIDREEFRQALPGCKQWFEADFFSGDLDQDYERAKGYRFDIDAWRRMFKRGGTTCQQFAGQ